MVDLNQQTKKHDTIGSILDNMPTPEKKFVEDNLEFENDIVTNPIPPKEGRVDVFGETWDANMILKGNYWKRTIYTTDKLLRLVLKWDIETQKKYLQKKKMMDFNYAWLILLIIGGVAALLVLIFLLPQMGI